MKRAKRRGLLRNVALALGIWGNPNAVPVLARALVDEEPLVRGLTLPMTRRTSRWQKRWAVRCSPVMVDWLLRPATRPSSRLFDPPSPNVDL